MFSAPRAKGNPPDLQLVCLLPGHRRHRACDRRREGGARILGLGFRVSGPFQLQDLSPPSWAKRVRVWGFIGMTVAPASTERIFRPGDHSPAAIRVVGS